MNAWIFIFSDLIALLVAFFVMLYSFADINKARWENFVSQAYHGVTIDKIDDNKIYYEEIESGLDIDYVSNLVKQKIGNYISEVYIMENGYHINGKSEKFIIRFPKAIFFENGILIQGYKQKEIINIIGNIIEQLPNRVDILGYKCGSQNKEDIGEMLQASYEIFNYIYKYGYIDEVVHIESMITNNDTEDFDGACKDDEFIDVIINLKKDEYY